MDITLVMVQTFHKQLNCKSLLKNIRMSPHRCLWNPDDIERGGFKQDPGREPPHVTSFLSPYAAVVHAAVVTPVVGEGCCPACRGGDCRSNPLAFGGSHRPCQSCRSLRTSSPQTARSGHVLAHHAPFQPLAPPPMADLSTLRTMLSHHQEPPRLAQGPGRAGGLAQKSPQKNIRTGPLRSL